MKIIRSAFSLLCSAALVCPFLSALPTAADPVSFTESTETLSNPGMGYTTTLWYRCALGNTPVKNPTGALVLMFIDIGAFSSGENGTTDSEGNYIPGTDYPLDGEFFSGLRGTLENCRRNGCTVAMRFRYDDDGTRDPEPATFDMLKSHLQQIKDSRIFSDYADILMYVESGFVGCYGEQWGGKYCSLTQKAELLELLLDAVPDPIPVTVRTPNIFAQWVNIPVSALGEWVSEPGSKAARVGLYDDGYMGSDSDLGTYSNRVNETAWLGKQTLTSYFGGEFSGDLEFAQKYDTYLPENAIPEMYRTHLSYINGNIYQLYKNYSFGQEYDVTGVDNSAYYGQTVFKFIRDHLGYRFVLRSADVPKNAVQGSVIKIPFSVENTGFASPIREQKAELLLESGGCYYRAPLNLDSRLWRSCTTTEELLNIRLPGGLAAGEWNVYLKLSVGDNTVNQLSLRSVRFANQDIWNAALGANYLGTVKISASNQTAELIQSSLSEIGSVEGDGRFYTVNGQQITDGVISNAGETDKSLLLAESDTGKLYVTNDEQYLYIRALFGTEADAPVCNISFKNTANNTDYWLYYASNGFVYFNQGTPEGVVHQRGAGVSEFRIPFGDIMGLSLGTKLTGLRFSLQDSANDWKVLSDVRAAEYTLSGDFPVYNAKQQRSLREGESLILDVQHGAGEDAAYVWMYNGKPIVGAASQQFILKNASAADVGTYSVQITSPAGTVKTADICEILNVYGDNLRGDLNADGIVSNTDADLLLQYLLTQTPALPLWEAGDLDEDGTITANDLSQLKRLIPVG